MKKLLEKIVACKSHVNIFKHRIDSSIYKTKIKSDLEDVIETCSNSYSLVLWPESQEYMEEDWFQEEAILYQALSEKQEYLSSAYFIPNVRL